MPETALQSYTSSFLNKSQLIKLRLKAIRAGAWFRVLPRIDRVLIDLTIKVANNIRSITLAKNILAIIGKLEGFLKSGLLRALRAVGLPLAQKLSLSAQKWGNTSAKSWASDSTFANFLAVMHLNSLKGLKHLNGSLTIHLSEQTPCC
jgi:hypothetical protein